LSPATNSRPLLIWPAASRRESSAENCCADATFGATTANIAVARPSAVEVVLDLRLRSSGMEIMLVCLDQVRSRMQPAPGHAARLDLAPERWGRRDGFNGPGDMSGMPAYG
jgi:hypothetical protein